MTQTTARPKITRSIVIIGAGGIVRDGHLPAYAKAGFPVVGLFDRDRARSQALALQLGIHRVYESLAEAIRETLAETVFDVAVPVSAILEILPGLPDGCGVLVQKPLIGSMSRLMCFLEGSSSELATSVEDAYKTMALVEAWYRSSENGGRVPVFEDAFQ